jgi:hypothetical protein
LQGRYEAVLGKIDRDEVEAWRKLPLQLGETLALEGLGRRVVHLEHRESLHHLRPTKRKGIHSRPKEDVLLHSAVDGRHQGIFCISRATDRGWGIPILHHPCQRCRRIRMRCSKLGVKERQGLHELHAKPSPLFFAEELTGKKIVEYLWRVMRCMIGAGVGCQKCCDTDSVFLHQKILEEPGQIIARDVLHVPARR